MFERFTNRARHVIVLSQEEARLLSHNYIGTEHILLGLLAEPESIGGQVLAGFGLTLDGVREEVVEKIGRGKSKPAGHIPFTPRAKKTLELSLREALSIKHNYIGTEHILLGLIREGEGVAAQILRDHADLLEIRAAVLTTVSATYSGDEGEGSEETNAVLRWLRQRLSRHGTASLPFRPEVASAEPATRGTPAVEAALRNIAYARAQQARGRGAPVSGETQAAAIDPNAVQGLKSAAVPLILSFNSEQKDEVRNLAHVMGLDQLASQF